MRELSKKRVSGRMAICVPFWQMKTGNMHMESFPEIFEKYGFQIDPVVSLSLPGITNR